MEAVQIFTAAVASLTLLGVALGRLPALKMNRATIALVGATLLVAGGVLSLDQAYRAVDWNTLLLLFGMMVLNVNLRAGGFFQRVTAGVIRFAKTPRRLLALIIGASGVLSAVFLNDTIVLVFTPLVLDVTLALRRNPLPYLVGLVTAANIGSDRTRRGRARGWISHGVSVAPSGRSSRALSAICSHLPTPAKSSFVRSPWAWQ
jgi:Na+/H+ antiporter NhaD/arsenite permease-like protein